MSIEDLEKIINEKELQRKTAKTGSKKDFYILGQIDLLKQLVADLKVS